MKTKEFEDLVMEHSIPGTDIMYVTMALAGEVGEICNNVKKAHMAKIFPELVKTAINPLLPASHFEILNIEELGDVLFYLTLLALRQGFTLKEIMDQQAMKLFDQSEKYERTFLK